MKARLNRPGTPMSASLPGRCFQRIRALAVIVWVLELHWTGALAKTSGAIVCVTRGRMKVMAVRSPL